MNEYIQKQEKVWGLTPRWDGTQGLLQWVQIVGGWILGLLVLAAFVSWPIEEYRMARDGTRFEVTYIEIADGTQVKCMYDNSWNETFACEWPTR